MAQELVRPPMATGASMAPRRICGLDILPLEVGEAITIIRNAVVARSPEIFGFCNAHTVNMARSRKDFAAAMHRATLFNDGIGVDMAGRILYGSRFPANLNGTDLTPAVLEALPPGTGVYLVGSPPGVAAQARAVLAARYPHLHLAGAEHGYFAEDEERAVVARIRRSGAALVLVGMGHPRQELWAARNVDDVGAVMMCVGAFFDFTAGVVSRAPRWIREARIEWAYRLLLEPRRLARRYLLGNATFLAAVLCERVSFGRR